MTQLFKEEKIETINKVDLKLVIPSAIVLVLNFLDHISTYIFISKYGTRVEGNPIMRWLYSFDINTTGFIKIFTISLLVFAYSWRLDYYRTNKDYIIYSRASRDYKIAVYICLVLMLMVVLWNFGGLLYVAHFIN